MVKQFTDDDDALLAELEVENKKVAARTPPPERVIAGFEEIQRFFEEHGYPPRHGEDNDIFERLYAVRLDRLRELAEFRPLLEPVDNDGLLTAIGPVAATVVDEVDDAALLAELGIKAETADITELRHVRSSTEKKAAEEIANQQKCEGLERFKPLFDQVQNELDTGLRATRPFERKAEIAPGRFFIVGEEIAPGRFFIVGEQKSLCCGNGRGFSDSAGMTDARLRVIFDNGTESNMLMRSLQRALHKDDADHRITDSSAGRLFADHTTDGDEAGGTIYVLRSKSDLPIVKEHRNVLHKIGVTSGKVERRIANAKIDATFLLADIDVVATLELYNINSTKIENLIHRIFDPARLDIEIKDRFGNAVVPRERFHVPFEVVDEAVERIKDGSKKGYVYDPQQARLVERKAG